MQSIDPIYVDVTQSSSELLELRKQVAAGRVKEARDLPVDIVLEDAAATRRKAGSLLRGNGDPNTGSYTLRIVVPNPAQMLLPGIYVRAVVGSGVREGGLLVQQRGIARDRRATPRRCSSRPRARWRRARSR